MSKSLKLNSIDLSLKLSIHPINFLNSCSYFGVFSLVWSIRSVGGGRMTVELDTFHDLCVNDQKV